MLNRAPACGLEALPEVIRDERKGREAEEHLEGEEEPPDEHILLRGLSRWRRNQQKLNLFESTFEPQDGEVSGQLEDQPCEQIERLDQV